MHVQFIKSWIETKDVFINIQVPEKHSKEKGEVTEQGLEILGGNFLYLK